MPATESPSPIVHIAHMVDTTNLGGAERMAINFANDLARLGTYKVTLIVSRSAGVGSSLTLPEVQQICLHKRRAMDVPAFRRFVHFLQTNNVELLHAHTNSVYWAMAAKVFFVPNMLVVWHDHLGARANSSKKFSWLATGWSRLLDGYIGVSALVMGWANRYIKLKNEQVIYLPNYPELPLPTQTAVEKFAARAGSPTFLCLGNYREEKEQLLLIHAFQKVLQYLPEAKLWLAGKDIQPAYKATVMELIDTLQLQHQVVDWGECTDVGSLITAADIGVFASRFEGLPVSLLEFGWIGKPIVATEVGEIPKILGYGKWGALVQPQQEEALTNAMVSIGRDKALQKLWAKDLNYFVQKHFSKAAVIEQLTAFYTNTLKGVS